MESKSFSFAKKVNSLKKVFIYSFVNLVWCVMLELYLHVR